MARARLHLYHNYTYTFSWFDLFWRWWWWSYSLTYCNRMEKLNNLIFFKTNWSKCYNFHFVHSQKDGKGEALAERKTTAQQLNFYNPLARASPPVVVPHCQGLFGRWSRVCHSSHCCIPTADGCCWTPADEFSGWETDWSPDFQFFSRETTGDVDLCHTWGEDWGGERDSPGSDPLNPTTLYIFLSFFWVDATVLEHEGTVCPLLVFLTLLFVDEHPWFDKINMENIKWCWY